MRKWLLIWFCCLGSCIMGQEDPARLAAQLTSKATTEKEKVTAIFNWITSHISYRVRLSGKVNVIGPATRKFVKDLSGQEEDTGALKPLNIRVAETVLQTRLATCEGYAKLFTTLCDFAGIRSEIIPGYARPMIAKSDLKFGVNHYWNAVSIDGKWRLLDATWASGYVNGSSEFIREYDPKYFLADPAEFITDHYPDDLRWTLLPMYVTPTEFLRSPFIHKSYFKYAIQSFFPKKGILEPALGDTLYFEVASSNSANDHKISPDYLVDSSLFSFSENWIFLTPGDIQPDQPGALRRYQLPITRPGIEWVYLLYNGDMVLRYRIKVKSAKEEEKTLAKME